MEAIKNWNELMESIDMTTSSSLVDRESFIQAEQLLRVFCDYAGGEDQVKLFKSVPELIRSYRSNLNDEEADHDESS